jgi:hypothetical protein
VPALVGIAFATGSWALLPRALLAGLLSTIWAASACVLLGLRAKGPAAASALWIVIALANLLAVLRVWTGLDATDWLVRVIHALPGPSAAEAVATATDPWRLGALALLAAQTLVLFVSAWAASARLTRAVGTLGIAAALALPFAAPAVGA